MPANESFANNLSVEVGGRPLADDVKTLLTYAYVDDSRNLPDMFLLRFRDPGNVVLAKAGFTIGVKVELKVQTSDPGGPATLLAGEVTALGVDLDRTGTFTEVRGYDQAHRLFRGRRVAAYPDMAIADVVRTVTERAGLQAGTIDAVSGVGGRPHTQVSQAGVSDWEFLSRLASSVGAQVTVADGKLDFRLPEQPQGAPEPTAEAHIDPLVLEAQRTLISLRATVTAAEQVPEVEVRGWDVDAKQEVTATASTRLSGTEVAGVDPVGLANTFGSPPFLIADATRRTHPEAKAVAEAAAAQLGGACVELEGVARGNPKLRAGTAVSLTNVGEPFTGKYTLTATRHLFAAQGGYTTEFTVSGRQERSLYGLVSGGAPATPVGESLVPGIVCDAKDPAKLGRVKLTFPWLSSEFTSGWARVVQAGAGNGRGTLVLPEVGDEVLVGFEHGDVEAPYVLGGLHNGKDAVPELSTAAVDQTSGQIAARGFVSREGHKLEFVEADGILLASGDGSVVVRLDQKNQTIELKAANGVSIDAGGGKLELKGQSASVDAGASLDITAGGTATVSGSLVKIN